MHNHEHEDVMLLNLENAKCRVSLPRRLVPEARNQLGGC